MPATISAALDWWGRNIPSQPALVFQGDALTYAALDRWVSAVANEVHERGVRPGDRVGILGINSLGWAAAMLATVRAGAIVVPLNARYAPDELRSVLADCSPSLIISDDDFVERLTDSGPRVLRMSDVLALRAAQTTRGLVSLDPEDPVVVAYTSGSTSMPKGVVFTHRTMLSYAFESGLNDRAYHRGARFLILAPLFAGAGTVNLVQTIVTGMTAYLEPSFDPDTCLKILVEERISIFTGVPIFWERIAACAGFRDADFSHLKRAAVGGARVSMELLEAWRAKGVRLRQLYGLTEGGGSNSTMDEEGALLHPEKVGRGGIFTRLLVVDPEGVTCAPGRTGEIILQGPSMMKGYWNNPEATSSAMRGGWLHTGDIGMADAEGNITIVDRLKDIIISGGLNIPSIDIENVIAEVAGVREVAVIAAHDPKFGETPMAVVCGDERVSVATIVAHCNKRLANYKVPRFIVVSDDPLPRLSSGKISKRALRDQHRDAHQTLERVR